MISHSAPLVPLIVLKKDGNLIRQLVRCPTVANMYSKAGLKTASGGFRLLPCPGLWPGWYLFARPPSLDAPWSGPGDVPGPAVFVALDGGDPNASNDDTALLIPRESLSVADVIQMRRNEPRIAAADSSSSSSAMDVGDKKEKEAADKKATDAMSKKRLGRSVLPPAKKPKKAPLVKKPKKPIAARKIPKKVLALIGAANLAEVHADVVKQIADAIQAGDTLMVKTLAAVLLSKMGRRPPVKRVPRKPVVPVVVAPVLTREDFEELQLESYDE